MPKPTKKKDTPGQKLFFELYRSTLYDQQAGGIVSSAESPKNEPLQVTNRWLEGMSRSLKEKFSTELRQLREELKLTQQQLAETAGLSVTAVAMLERGERQPSLDTATRLCWALDVAAGVMLEDL